MSEYILSAYTQNNNRSVNIYNEALAPFINIYVLVYATMKY
jgi:hypothetical protein